MKPLAIVVVLALMLGVGIYIGLSGFMAQYSFVPGRSSASTALCSPDASSVSRGASAHFTASGLPPGTQYHWASDDGRTEASADGSFSVMFSTAGTKTVSLFFFEQNAWFRTTCQVQVR